MQKQQAGTYGGSRPTVANYAVNSEELKFCVASYMQKDEIIQKNYFFFCATEPITSDGSTALWLLCSLHIVSDAFSKDLR